MTASPQALNGGSIGVKQTSGNSVILPVGTPVINCEKYTSGNPERCALNYKIENDGNTGQLINSSGQLIFYSPTYSECIPNPSVPPSLNKCRFIIELDLEQIDNEQFIRASNNRNFIDAIKKEFPSLLQTSLNENLSVGKPDSQGIPARPVSNQPPYLLWGGLSLGVLAILCATFLYVNRSTTQKKNGARKQPAYVTPGSLFTPQNPSSSPASLNSQIATLNASLSRIASKLDVIENEVLALSQRVASIESSNITSNKPRVSMRGTEVSTFPAIQSQIRTPISPDLIQKALLTADYQLIKESDHVFLSETLQSQQGLEESKTFMVDGGRDQADQCSQSEFIAIYHDGVHYLIPNILPNAANPSRTIKRHADVNNIFLYGNGTNIQNLSTLATLEKSGAGYRLLSKGQIA